MSIYDYSPSTIAARVGTEVDRAHHSLGIPIYMTNNYTFEDPAQGALLAQSPAYGDLYTRISNPTNNELGKAMAALEGGEYGLAFSSGMAAISTLMLTLLKAGDHVLCDDTTYSATAWLLRDLLPKFGVESSFLDFTDLKAVRAAMWPSTKLVIYETPCNPTMKVIDIAEISADRKSTL